MFKACSLPSFQSSQKAFEDHQDGLGTGNVDDDAFGLGGLGPLDLDMDNETDDIGGIEDLFNLDFGNNLGMVSPYSVSHTLFKSEG